MNKCSRCGNERKTILQLMVHPSGHSLPSAVSPDYTVAKPPQTERVCGDCFTDDEIVRMLGPSVAFVLGVMIRRDTQQPEGRRSLDIPSLEMLRACFMVRNNDDSDGRQAALRALGL